MKKLALIIVALLLQGCASVEYERETWLEGNLVERVKGHWKNLLQNQDVLAQFGEVEIRAITSSEPGANVLMLYGELGLEYATLEAALAKEAPEVLQAIKAAREARAKGK